LVRIIGETKKIVREMTQAAINALNKPDKKEIVNSPPMPFY